MITTCTVPTIGKKVISTITGGSLAITAMFFCNTNNDTQETVNIYLVPAGVDPGDGNKIINNLIIAKSDTYVFDKEKIILENGDYVYASSTIGSITATVSSIDI